MHDADLSQLPLSHLARPDFFTRTAMCPNLAPAARNADLDSRLLAPACRLSRACAETDPESVEPGFVETWDAVARHGPFSSALEAEHALRDVIGDRDTPGAPGLGPGWLTLDRLGPLVDNGWLPWCGALPDPVEAAAFPDLAAFADALRIQLGDETGMVATVKQVRILSQEEGLRMGLKSAKTLTDIMLRAGLLPETDICTITLLRLFPPADSAHGRLAAQEVLATAEMPDMRGKTVLQVVGALATRLPRIPDETAADRFQRAGQHIATLLACDDQCP